jgi:glycosyltransferase
LKFSIITVVFNNIDFIEDAIKSVFSQKYDLIEYIIIDGGSSDGTIEAIQKYNKEISTFISEPDKGIYDAMNKGIELSTGDIVCFLHSDDIYNSSEIIQKVSNLFIQNSNIDGVYGDMVYTSKKNLNNVVRYWKSQSYDESLLSKGWMPPHPTLFLKRKVYERVGKFNQNFQISGDYDFILRLFLSKDINIIYLPEVLYMMRFGGASNKSIRSLIIKMREDLRALKYNNVGGLKTLIIKNFSKLNQFYNK